MTELHGPYYAEHWGFDFRIEVKVAQELGAFLAGFREGRDGFWVASLTAARRLYERHGFRLCAEQRHDQWRKVVLEQKFERRARLETAGFGNRSGRWRCARPALRTAGSSRGPHRRGMRTV